MLSWIYRIWIHRASVFVPDLIRRRLHGGGAALLWNDSVSGLIIATFIIFSFLSLVRYPPWFLLVTPGHAY